MIDANEAATLLAPVSAKLARLQSDMEFVLDAIAGMNRLSRQLRSIANDVVKDLQAAAHQHEEAWDFLPRKD